MLYTERRQLTILELDKEKESISIEDIKEILIDKPSNVIYCELEGKLAGIISTGDIWRILENNSGKVTINRDFTYIYYGEYARAKAIFKEKSEINALPVVTENNVLVGDYTRWDDLLVLEHLIKNDKGRCIVDWYNRENIILVCPGSIFTDRHIIFEKMKNYLKSQGLTIKCIKHTEVAQHIKGNNIILFTDENEICACRIVQRIIFGTKENEFDNLKTYKSVFSRNYGFSDENYISYLKKLQKEGIKILGLVFNESTYYKSLSKKMEKKFATIGVYPNAKWPKKIYEDFFANLYNEEYADHLSNLVLVTENHGGVLSLKDFKSKYCNVINGERYTTNQPSEYMKNICFFGPCYIQGVWVEDKNTIESLLQENICRDNLRVRVVNCGAAWTDSSEHMYLPRIAVTQLKRGDIIVVDRPPRGIEGVYYLDLSYILEKNNVGTEWMLESVFHCNHRVNKLYADEIYNILLPVLCEKVKRKGELIDKDENFVKSLYLDRYFSDFDPTKYKKIGSVVMNCNPFTYGHRYLIEYALQDVDFLIVFVVEQDKSFFSFAERFAMVQKGVRDLENIKVVPSGQFMASQMTIPEYFGKQLSKNASEHNDQDFKVFAKQIAWPLGISVRFFGEEPLDSVTNQYNVSAQKVLPQYGIKTVIIPRKTVHAKVISASVVRKYLNEVMNFSRIEELLPETTRKVMGII